MTRCCPPQIMASNQPANCGGRQAKTIVTPVHALRHPQSQPATRSLEACVTKKGRSVLALAPFKVYVVFAVRPAASLFQMSADELGHFEHRDLLLAAEDRQEFFIRVDLRALL